MKKNKKEIKPYTRIHTPKVVYTRKGRRNGKEALV